jgi:hypothetical protein
MYVTPDRLPPELTTEEIVAGLRRLALDAGTEAHRTQAGPWAVQKRAESRLLNHAAELIRSMAETS